MKIIVRYAYGLGNQLFQYALMQSLKERYPEAEILGDISYYKMMQEHFGFDLPIFFDVDLKTISYGEARKYCPKYLVSEKNIPKYSTLYRKIRYTPLGTAIDLIAAKKAKKYSVSIVTEEPNVEYEYVYQLNEKCETPFYLAGFWQNTFYLNHCENIHKYIRFKEEILTGEEKNQLNYIRSNNCVSVHIRRGDYLLYQEYNICTLEYYRRALTLVQEKLGDIPIIYFSDDADFVNNNFILRESDRIISSGASRGGCDMFLMSCCNAHIIANSSFSFWGAYLDQNSNKVVIAPKIFKRTKYMSYLFKIPSSWIALDV